MGDLLSLRAYGRHRRGRGLPGTSHSAVRKAIQTGRIFHGVRIDAKGRERIDPKIADEEWTSSTDARKQRAARAGGAPPAAAEEQPELFADAGPRGLPQSTAPAIARSHQLQAVYKAQLTRLDYLQRAGKLVERAAVEAQAFATAREVRDNLLQIAYRLETQLAAETDPAACRELMLREIRAALSALAPER